MVECVTHGSCSQVMPLTGICPACTVPCSPRSWTHPKAQPVPWEGSQFGPIRTWSGRHDSGVPWRAWEVWELTASLALKWMLQGEPEPDHGQWGWAHRAGCCLLTVLGDRKGVWGSCQHTQGGHVHTRLGTGLMRPEGERQSLRAEWNSWTFSRTSGLASRGSWTRWELFSGKTNGPSEGSLMVGVRREAFELTGRESQGITARSRAT